MAHVWVLTSDIDYGESIDHNIVSIHSTRRGAVVAKMIANRRHMTAVRQYDLFTTRVNKWHDDNPRFHHKKSPEDFDKWKNAFKVFYNSIPHHYNPGTVTFMVQRWEVDEL